MQLKRRYDKLLLKHNCSSKLFENRTRTCTIETFKTKSVVASWKYNFDLPFILDQYIGVTGVTITVRLMQEDKLV